MTIVFFNGIFIKENEAKIDATSRGALLGEGVFTSTLVEEGKILFFKEHIARLEKNAKSLGIKSKEIKIEDILVLISKNNFEKGSYRLRITLFSKEKYSNNFSDLSSSDLLIAIYPLSKENNKSLKLCLYKEGICQPFYNIKTLNYLDRFFLKKWALEKGFDDSLVLGLKSEILEASFSNIFWIEEKRFFLPSRSLPYFKGIILDFLIKYFFSLGYEIVEGHYKISHIPKRANVYLCNSVKKIMNVSQIGNQRFDVKELDLNFFS